MTRSMKMPVLVLLGAAAICTTLSAAVGLAPWQNDFSLQPVGARPPLEVRYTDARREAFEIVADRYHLLGELRKPHRLLDAETRKPWLTLDVLDSGGNRFATEFSPRPSRINLYRRGPYYCEVHWFDVSMAADDGRLAPIKGDLALYCYPDKLLMSIALHATEDFDAKSLELRGIVTRSFDLEPFRKGRAQRFAAPLFAESQPLPAAAMKTISATKPLRYDPRRGCYVIGSRNPGGFEEHFYRHPNHYETVEFSVTNDAEPRTIYVCHETSSGARGTVEGGVLLDDQGHPLPIVVQISKNFAGEKEERFYNPTDEPFSETWFPLVLGPNETCRIKSLHLYQNWGRHMVKQFSSLGAWMDYFHSSTGVTETTCYVPFKFAGLPGVAIADMRAMSQATFWSGQPQHDNVAGHSFLSYHDGTQWQYLVYRGTTYHSTGPNWMDVTLGYLSTDGKIRATVRTFELPQKDELRNFVHVRYEVLEPVSVKRARENLRLLSITSRIQKLRYTHFASGGSGNSEELTYSDDHLAVGGRALAPLPAFAAIFGEPKGSNAYVLRRFSAPFAPAAGVWCKKNGDCRLFLAANADEVALDRGDVIEFDAVFLPYGETDGAATCRREAEDYGKRSPRVQQVRLGRKVSDFPTVIRAENDRAEFTVGGGRDLIPVIVTGLSDYRRPRLYQRQQLGWRELSDARLTANDGLQVFCEESGTFGAVFLVASDSRPQELRFELEPGDAQTHAPVDVRVDTSNQEAPGNPLLIQTAWMDGPIRFRFPAELRTTGDDAPLPAARWARSEGRSLWFEFDRTASGVGGRVTPNDNDVDLEFWVRNRGRAPISIEARFAPDLTGTTFEDPTGERTWILRDGWTQWSTLAPPALSEALSHAVLVAVTSRDNRHIFAMAWPRPRFADPRADHATLHAQPRFPSCPPNRRAHLRGKLYLIQGTLHDLETRLRREILAPEK